MKGTNFSGGFNPTPAFNNMAVGNSMNGMSSVRMGNSVPNSSFANMCFQAMNKLTEKDKAKIDAQRNSANAKIQEAVKKLDQKKADLESKADDMGNKTDELLKKLNAQRRETEEDITSKVHEKIRALEDGKEQQLAKVRAKYASAEEKINQKASKNNKVADQLKAIDGAMSTLDSIDTDIDQALKKAQTAYDRYMSVDENSPKAEMQRGVFEGMYKQQMGSVNKLIASINKVK